MRRSKADYARRAMAMKGKRMSSINWPKVRNGVTAIAAFMLGGCGPSATTSDVHGTWVLTQSAPPVEVIVTFHPDFTFEQQVMQNGTLVESAKGTWELKGIDVWLRGFKWWTEGHWTTDDHYYWELRKSKRNPKLLALFGSVWSDRDGYIELTKK